MIENIENNPEVVETRILKIRKDGKLYLINKGCEAIIGIISKVKSIYYIEGYSNEFSKEQEAIDALI